MSYQSAAVTRYLVRTPWLLAPEGWIHHSREGMVAGAEDASWLCFHPHTRNRETEQEVGKPQN